ncbi:hypothetical protein [Propioniciclava flava]
MSTQVIAPPRYLATARDASLVADIALVLGGTALITASAFVIVPLPFTPVPIALSHVHRHGHRRGAGPCCAGR